MKASVIIPTKNGEKYLEEVLEMVFKQKAPFEFEVIVVDSGSTDRTLEILKKFPVKLYQIPPHEFNHGLTRNLAASKAKGEYLVFLTQDATPIDEDWLQNIVRPFEDDEEIASVFGRHLPRKECDPFQKKMLTEFMDSFKELTVYQLPKTGSREKEFEKNKHLLSFFSNVNSAIRKSIWQKIPFKRVEMGEDQFWAKEIILAGYEKVYQPKAAVYHSHHYGPWQQFKRWFDEFRQHKINQNYVGVSNIWKILPLTCRLFFNDIKYIKSQKEYNFWQKIYWSWWIFFIDLARIKAEYLGGRYEKIPQWLQNKFSMQYQLIHKK